MFRLDEGLRKEKVKEIIEIPTKKKEMKGEEKRDLRNWTKRKRNVT